MKFVLLMLLLPGLASPAITQEATTAPAAPPTASAPDPAPTSGPASDPPHPAPTPAVLDPLPAAPSANDGPLDPVFRNLTMLQEDVTAENLSAEDVDIRVHVNVTNAEFAIVGIVFGGGKVQTDVTLAAHLEFRALSLKRLDDAIRSSGATQNQSVSQGYNSSRTVITAEEFRLLAGGAALQAFQEDEEAAAVARLSSSLPGLTVLSSQFEWSNLKPTNPAPPEDPQGEVGQRVTSRRVHELREPPIVLDVRMELRYLDRVALRDIIEKQMREAGTDSNDTLKVLRDRVKQNQTVPPLERSAFMIAGIDQLLVFNVPPGWRMNLTFTVPKGYTIESATDELVLTRDHRTATYFADGSASVDPLDAAGVVTLSTRPAVISVILGAVLLVGILLRMPVEILARRLGRRAEKARKAERAHGDAEG